MSDKESLILKKNRHDSTREGADDDDDHLEDHGGQTLGPSPNPDENKLEDDGHHEGEYRTPTSDDHKIPEPKTCPPAPCPRRRGKLERCRDDVGEEKKKKKRKLGLFETSRREEVDEFFRSQQEAVADSSKNKKQKKKKNKRRTV